MFKLLVLIKRSSDNIHWLLTKMHFFVRMWCWFVTKLLGLYKWKEVDQASYDTLVRYLRWMNIYWRQSAGKNILQRSRYVDTHLIRPYFITLLNFNYLHKISFQTVMPKVVVLAFHLLCTPPSCEQAFQLFFHQLPSWPASCLFSKSELRVHWVHWGHYVWACRHLL